MKYALVDTTSYKVLNIIEVDSAGGYTPEVGQMLIQADDASPGDTWDGEGFIRPEPVLTPDEQAARLRGTAISLLRESDITVLRVLEDGLQLPDDWREYRSTLRQILTDGTGEIPERPAYPA